MELATVVPLVCNRRTKPMDFKIERELLSASLRAKKKPIRFRSTKMMTPKSSSAATKLNLADWIEEELILSLPLVPAHEEGCQTDGPEESKKTKFRSRILLQNSKISKVCVRSKVSVECLIFQERKRNCCPLDFES